MNFEADIIKTYGSSDTMRIIVQLFDENDQLMAKFAFDTPSLELNVERHMKVTNIQTSKELIYNLILK